MWGARGQARGQAWPWCAPSTFKGYPAGRARALTASTARRSRSRTSLRADAPPFLRADPSLPRQKLPLIPVAGSATQSLMDDEVKIKLTLAWRAAASWLIEAGYEPREVYATMTSVALSGAGGQANDNPPSAKVRPSTKRPTVPFREG